jgi:hypothetical protein
MSLWKNLKNIWESQYGVVARKIADTAFLESGLLYGYARCDNKGRLRCLRCGRFTTNSLHSIRCKKCRWSRSIMDVQRR